MSLGWYLYRKLPVEFRILTIQLSLMAFVETTLKILGLQGIRTIFLIHIFLPIDTFLLVYVFYIYFRNKSFAWLLPYLGFGFVLLSVLNSLFVQPIHTFNSYALYLKALMMIILSLTYFYQVFTELKVEKLWEEGMFWFCTGLMIYHAGTMLMYLSSNYLLQVAPKSFALLHTVVQTFCFLSMYSLFTIALWKAQWKKT